MNKMNFPVLRDVMVERHVAARGVRSPLVLEAMRAVPREAFLPPSLREFAYEDAPLPIAEGQTISQPYIVALMTEVLKGKTVGEAETLLAKFHNLLTTDQPLPKDLGKLVVFSGVREFPARVKCATLAWHTLRAALRGAGEVVSTE